MQAHRLLLSAAITGVLVTGFTGLGPAAGNAFVNWPQYLYSAKHTSDNVVATAITPANAASLRLAWKFVPPASPVTGLSGFYSSPTTYNGVIYIGGRNGNFYAIDEATGAVIWRRFIGVVTKTTCFAEGFTSTATVSRDPATGKPTVYVYGPTGYLYAMNTADGTDVWPPAPVAIPSTTVNDYYAWGSPLVFGGNVYVGIASECDVPLVRGGLKEFSQSTGTLEHTFWTTPAGTRGATIWSSPATNGQAVFISTGNGSRASVGFSIIRLTPSLSQRDIWTVPPKDRVPDSDFGASPGLWSADIQGTATPMVGACNKNGDFYALKASNLSAGPVWVAPIGDPYGSGHGQCDAAPLFDGTNLYLASNGTTINGTHYDGSVREINPATGAIVWQTGLTGALFGTPGMDGAGVIAAASFGSSTGKNGLFLINAANGHLLATISYGKAPTFGQPVFADNFIIVASAGLGLQAYAAG